MEKRSSLKKWIGALLIGVGCLAACEKNHVELPSEPVINEKDSLALLKIAEYLNGPFWYMPWDTLKPIQEWTHIELQERNGEYRVTTLFLNQHGMRGYLPDAIGDLTELEILSIDAGGIYGGFPSTFSNLHKLLFLGVTNTSMSGPLVLKGLTNLQSLEVRDNDYLKGGIPQEIVECTRLRKVFITETHVGGELPKGMDRMVSLEYLELKHSQLTGKIPPELGKLPKLDFLSLTGNQFSGEIPPELGYSPARDILMANNQLTGQVPETFENFQGSLAIAYNNLTGYLPDFILERYSVWDLARRVCPQNEGYGFENCDYKLGD